MWTLITQLWNDPAYFKTTVRGLLQTLGALIGTGVIPTSGPLWKIGFILMALGGFIPGSRPPVLDQVKAMKPEEKLETQIHLTNLTEPPSGK